MMFNQLGTTVIKEGDPVKHVYFLEKGIVKQKILKRSHNFPGNIFNITALCLEPESPVVIFDLETIGVSKFRKIPVGKKIRKIKFLEMIQNAMKNEPEFALACHRFGLKGAIWQLVISPGQKKFISNILNHLSTKS